jgi:hypothetical protein
VLQTIPDEEVMDQESRIGQDIVGEVLNKEHRMGETIKGEGDATRSRKLRRKLILDAAKASGKLKNNQYKNRL